MKRTYKGLSILLCLSMAASLAACGGKKAGENAPEIIGVADQSVVVGSEFDAMAGILAEDAEDGELTSKVTVTSLPELTFTNGKVTPENPGEYELTYSVTDSDGLETKAYATLMVTRQTGDATVLQKLDFTTAATTDDHGWKLNVADGVNASGEVKEGAYVIDIADPGNGDGDIQLVKSGLELKDADYRIKVWTKSGAKTYAHLLARNEKAEEWETFGGAFNLEIGETISPLELDFRGTAGGSAELLLNLGKITPNPDNPEDTSASNVTVMIDKIEIYEITGEQTQTPVYTSEFKSADDVAIAAGDGANGTAALADGAAVFTIDNYPTEGGVWSIKSDLVLPEISLEAGEKYYYTMTVVADKDQSGECLVESREQADAARANFNGVSFKAGEESVISNIFTAEAAVEDPVIRLQIGTPADGVTSNTLRVTKLEFGKVEGDLDTKKTIDSFAVSTAANTNPDCLWTTYNGTDEDNDLGVGTIWTEDGKLYYRIDQGGTVDWHNKLIIGHKDQPLTLPADSYFVIEITAKASQPVSCGFFLNTMGGWDPRISEGIDLTTEEQTFTFRTTEPLIMDMDFEMLFQFGSAETAGLGSVTVEISDITISQESIL